MPYTCPGSTRLGCPSPPPASSWPPRAREGRVLSEVEEFHISLRAAAGIADPGKAPAGIAAGQIALGHLFDDGPEEAVFFFEAALVPSQKPLEMMEQQTKDDGSLRMTRTVYAQLSGRTTSRITPRAGQTERESPIREDLDVLNKIFTHS